MRVQVCRLRAVTADRTEWSFFPRQEGREGPTGRTGRTTEPERVTPHNTLSEPGARRWAVSIRSRGELTESY